MDLSSVFHADNKEERKTHIVFQFLLIYDLKLAPCFSCLCEMPEF